MICCAVALTACGSTHSSLHTVDDGPITVAPAACWQGVLRDAYDGEIDGTFPPRCYRAAISHLPMDGASPLRGVLETGAAQAVGALVPSERLWATTRHNITVGRAGAARALAAWKRSLARDRLSVTPTRFRQPSRRWLLARIARLARIYHFRLIGFRYLHRFDGGARPAPLIIVRAAPDTFVRATRLVFPALDQKPRPNPHALVVWNYEAFFLEARDQFGAPFLAVFNNWRRPDPGGGQWASSNDLFPYPHG